MIIKKIEIENFMCYYGISLFKLSDGLNIILGANGEGKTKFYEAFEWLFDGKKSEAEKEKIVSQKKFKEIKIDTPFYVRVSALLLWLGKEYSVKRSFKVIKQSETELSISDNKIEVLVKHTNGENLPEPNAQDFLDTKFFPTEIRRYSMFKGETDLNIFNQSKALVNLIDNFSEAKKYEKFSQKGKMLSENAERILAKKSLLDKKNRSEYKTLENDINAYNRTLNSLKDEVVDIENSIDTYTSSLEDIERFMNNGEEVTVINTRIEQHRRVIDRVERDMKENYTESLFDNGWILQKFKKYHDEFSLKISEANKLRRKIEKDHDIKKGIKTAILNKDLIPLSLHIPNKETMMELVDDEFCKVCNRPAPKDSDAYTFMKSKLDEMILNESSTNEESFYKANHIRQLENIQAKHDTNIKYYKRIETDITDTFNFNNTLIEQRKEADKEIDKLESKRDNILGKTGESNASINSKMGNYKNWTALRSEKEKGLIHKNIEIDSYKEKLLTKKQRKDYLDNQSGSSYEIETRNILRDIETIFNETKQNEFNVFIDKLQAKSNYYLNKINVDSFTGKIVFDRKISENQNNIKPMLQSKDTKVYDYNTSLLTSMYISILFAISELSNDVNDEYYPWVFDAATSTFDQNKISHFLNSIHETSNQKILISKDFVNESNDEKNPIIIHEDFKNIKKDKAFWIKLKRPFDKEDLSTLETEVKEIK
jgi:DNA sulfur modification protein DndD